MASFFNEIFYRPLLNALVFLTGVLPFHDLGFAVIILTIVVRLILFPFSHRPMQAQHKMRALEPELTKIKETIKDREAQARQTMALYKQHGINPFAGIMSLFVQIPVFLALYWVFSKGVSIDPETLYSFVSVPSSINTHFLGIFDLTKRSILWAALAGATQFIHMKLTNHGGGGLSAAKGDFSKALSFQMTYGMPLLIFFISLSFPAVISLYWTTSNIFSILHEGFLRRKIKHINQPHDARNNKNSGNDSNLAS